MEENTAQLEDAMELHVIFVQKLMPIENDQ